MNSAVVHQMLAERTMGKNETLKEYFCHMRQLASRGCIEDDALIKYTRDGINDDPRNKAVLFGTYKIAEFREKLDLYEEIRSSCKTHYERATSSTTRKLAELLNEDGAGNPRKMLPDKVQCYNCGIFGHFASNCTAPKRERNSCFKCGSLAHQKKNCPQRQSSPSQTFQSSEGKGKTISWITDYESLVPTYDVLIKLVVSDEEINAVVDSGSPISVTSKHVIPECVSLNPYRRNIQFQGVNQTKLHILEELNQKIKVWSISLPITFYAVPENTIYSVCLLGRDFLSSDGIQTTLLGNKIKIDVMKPVNGINFDVEDEISSILNIDVSNDNVEINEPDLDINNELSWEIQSDVKNIVCEYYINAKKPEQPVTNLELELKVKSDTVPFCYRPRRLSYSEKAAVTNISNDLLGREIIQPSNSQFCSPIALAHKKDGNIRMAVDYRALNKITLKNHCGHVDHYGPLGTTVKYKYRYIFEIIDAFTKFVKFYPVKTTNSDEVIKWLECYFANYSKPVKLVSD